MLLREFLQENKYSPHKMVLGASTTLLSAEFADWISFWGQTSIVVQQSPGAKSVLDAEKIFFFFSEAILPNRYKETLPLLIYDCNP